MNQLQQAIDDCSKALKLDETCLKALLRRAKWYSELGLLEEAVYDYEKACKLDKSRGKRKISVIRLFVLEKSRFGTTRKWSLQKIRSGYSVISAFSAC